MMNTTIEQEIENFKNCIGRGMAEFKKAALQYVDSIRRHSNAAEKYAKEIPYFMQRDWDMMRKIGNGDLSVMALLIGEDSVIDRVSTLPMKTQLVLLGDENTPPRPQKVVVGDKVVEKCVKDMTFQQITNLLDTESGKVRSVAKQRALIRKNVAKELDTEIPSRAPYFIKGTDLIIRRATTIGINELMKIVADMKGTK